MKFRTLALITCVALVGGCASNKTHVNADAVEKAAVVGTWRGTQNQQVRIEHEGDAYGIDATGAGGAASEYPLRILRIGGTDIAEVEVDRAEQGDAVGVGYVYGRITATDKTLEYRGLKQSWLQGRSTPEGLRVSPLAGGRASLGVGSAKEMTAMLEAAVADENAWDPPETWTRVR